MRKYLTNNSPPPDNEAHINNKRSAQFPISSSSALNHQEKLSVAHCSQLHVSNSESDSYKPWICPWRQKKHLFKQNASPMRVRRIAKLIQANKWSISEQQLSTKAAEVQKNKLGRSWQRLCFSKDEMCFSVYLCLSVCFDQDCAQWLRVLKHTNISLFYVWHVFCRRESITTLSLK